MWGLRDAVSVGLPQASPLDMAWRRGALVRLRLRLRQRLRLRLFLRLRLRLRLPHLLRHYVYYVYVVYVV